MSTLQQRQQAKKKTVVTFYRTYHFRANEKDPIIDKVMTIMDDVGMSFKQVHELSGLATTTLYNWKDGPTRKPQYASICATLRAMGYDFAIVKSNHNAPNGKTWEATAPSTIKRYRGG